MVLPFLNKEVTMLVKTISALILAGFMSGTLAMAAAPTPAPKSHHGKKPKHHAMKKPMAPKAPAEDSMKGEDEAPMDEESH